ncbi:MAG: acyltransferase domain-containing protein [Planctomycetota bacterium]
MSRAILFPGQGAQHPGMAAEIVAAIPAAMAVLDLANDVLRINLKKLILEGPAERLEDTDICQPAILATSAAVVEALRHEKGLQREQFAATAGLSLGEYTALWFAGSLTLEDALRLVRIRGAAMQDASTRNPSGMISLLGADREQAQLLADAGSAAGVLVPANYLCPGSIALSGAVAALDLAAEKAKEFGIRRTVRLKVAGAFHSPLMASATEALRDALASIEISPPAIPFSTNVTGDRVSDPERIRAHLAAQVTSPVLWEDTIRRFCERGIRTYVEPAPGSVLTGLLKKGAPGSIGVPVLTLDDLKNYS